MCRALSSGGRTLIIVGAAADGYRIYTADNKVKESVEVAGGAVVVGGVGYFAGEKLAEEAYELVVDDDPIFVGPED